MEALALIFMVKIITQLRIVRQVLNTVVKLFVMLLLLQEEQLLIGLIKHQQQNHALVLSLFREVFVLVLINSSKAPLLSIINGQSHVIIKMAQSLLGWQELPQSQ